MKKFLILMVLLLGLSLCGCRKADKTEPETFTVTFDSVGGSSVEPQSIERGYKVKKPTDPTKECGCEFDGWYCGDEKWSFIGYVVTEDITLTAKWVDCFGMNEKERAILEDFVKRNAGTWRDIASVERTYDYDADAFRYKIIGKNGVTKTIDIARELAE